MTALMGLGGLLGFLVCLILLIIKVVKKKPKKKTLIALCVCFVLFCSALVTPTPKPQESVPAPTAEATITPTSEPTFASTSEPAPTSEITNLSFELIAGEPGEYGELFTINKDTEFEETYYIYRVPAGSYTVTNSGEYPEQFNVYSEKVYVVDGWEELSDVFYVKLLAAGESDSFTIEDGQIIEIHEPGRFLLEKTA